MDGILKDFDYEMRHVDMCRIKDEQSSRTYLGGNGIEDDLEVNRMG